jgi:hypothetical protein
MQAVDHAHHIIGGRAPRQGSDEAFADLEIVEIQQLVATPPPQHTTPLAQDAAELQDPVVPNLQTTPEWKAKVEALTTQAGVDSVLVRIAPNS